MDDSVSLRTVAASSKGTPCFCRLLLAFSGAHSQVKAMDFSLSFALAG